MQTVVIHFFSDFTMNFSKEAICETFVHEEIVLLAILLLALLLPTRVRIWLGQHIKVQNLITGQYFAA